MLINNAPCLEHSDSNCGLCYTVLDEKKTRRSRPTILPRLALRKSIELSLEERVNLKALAPILAQSELDKYRSIADEPLTQEELDFLIENRL